MVVTRKTPTVPAPPVSRTASSQQTPRIAKGKAPQTIPNTQGVSVADVSVPGTSSRPDNLSNRSGSLNGTDSSPQKHKSKSKKTKKKSQKRGATFWDFLIRLLFISFVIYTIQVCPNDTNHESPVCYGLSKSRELILDRYLFPAFHRVLVHPSVAPYVERVKPPINLAIRVGKPIVRRTQNEWNGRVVPQWNKRVVPQWHKRVVPQWNKHVVPKLVLVDQKIEPYRTRVSAEYNRYSSRFAPHVKLAIYKLQRWQRQAQPYIILVATKTHDGYQTAKPYTIPVWNRVKAGTKQLLLFAREQRVLFVDPHVARIWEKVKELSSGNPNENATLKEPASPSPAAPITRVDDPTEYGVVPPATPKTIASIVSGWTESASASKAAASSASSMRPDVYDSTPSSSTVASSLSEDVTPTPDITGPSIIIAEPTLTPFDGEGDDNLDLDELARELGLDDSASPQAAEAIVPPPAETESEEEKAERLRKRLEETAEQRGDIMSRFSKWEADLQELVKARKNSLRKALVTIRKAAVVELKENKGIKDAIEGLSAEAEKYLKRAGAYLKALKKEGKTDAVKVDLWDKVIERVDGKFSDQLKDTEGVLEVWHMHVLNQETQEVRQVTIEVSQLSEKAQTDLGLDLAWLDDVTYADWQRYHDLARVSENFTELAASIQNGTHHSPPIDPIPPALGEFKYQIQEIARDFDAQLQQLKHDGQFAFGRHVGNEDMTMSTSPPEISILPVPDEEIERHDATGEIPPVFIGRSKDEVADALGRAEKEGAGAFSSQNVEDDESVADATQEASMKASQGVPVHMEL